MATKKSAGYKVDFAAKTLTITKEFADKAQDPNSNEFALLMNFQNTIPGLTVIRRTHATPRKYTNKQGEKFNCNQFKNLTYDNMKAFIEGLPNKNDYLPAYTFLRHNASLVQTARYKVVREWFVAQFPEFRKNPLYYLYNPVKVIDIAPFIQESQDKAEDKKSTSVAEGEANSVSGF